MRNTKKKLQNQKYQEKITILQKKKLQNQKIPRQNYNIENTQKITKSKNTKRKLQKNKNLQKYYVLILEFHCVKSYLSKCIDV